MMEMLFITYHVTIAPEDEKKEKSKERGRGARKHKQIASQRKSRSGGSRVD